MSTNRTNKWPSIALLLLACALLVFPCLASMNIIPSPRGHEGLASGEIGDHWRFKIFVAFAKERVGDDETEMGQSIYFVPSKPALVTISTIYKNGIPAESKVISSTLFAVLFIGLVVFAIATIIRFVFKFLGRIDKDAQSVYGLIL